MRHTERQPDQLLADQVRITSRAAVERGSVTEEEVASLERLARLTQLARGADRRRRRTVAVATVVAGALVATALAALRVRSTDVLIDVHVSEVRFRLGGGAAAALFSHRVPVAWLDARGVEAVTVPSAVAHRRTTYRRPDFHLETTPDTSGTVDLQPREAAVGALVTLRLGDAPRSYEMRVSGDQGEYQIVVAGRITLAVGEEPLTTVPLQRPSLIRVHPDSSTLAFNLGLADHVDRVLLLETTVIDSLFLFRDALIGDAVTGRRLLVSSIDSGSLAYESLDRAPKLLRRGETLWLAGSQGRLWDVQLGERGISLRYQGRVRRMHTGAGSARRNLMPSWMEWLSGRAAIPFVWGTTLYLLGAVLAVLRWWTSPT